MKAKVLIAMSGGVDSSVSAVLLKGQGYEVVGATMDLFDNGEKNASRAVVDARQVAEQLGIEHHVFDLSREFREEIIRYFIEEYKQGRTPNPCVRCNRRIKFGLLAEKGRELGCESIATGHYALFDGGLLKRGKDTLKDQSYFLYTLYGNTILPVLFPAGMLTKAEVRKVAAELNLPNATKEESQDICFIPQGDYVSFLLSSGIPAQKGPILDSSGKFLGYHNGIHQYTIGQRKGLGALGSPMFVTRILPAENTVVAGPENELFSDVLCIREFIHGPFDISADKSYDVQIRYRSAPVKGMIVSVANEHVIVRFQTPVKAVAPGQSAVLYENETVVGGGLISSFPE